LPFDQALNYLFVTVETLPPKIHNAYWFQAFNAVSWQLCLGTPLILFARELGAPAVVLGLLAGLAPLTSVLQLLVAPSAERIGYRRLLLMGWSARVGTLLLLTALPVAALFLPANVSIALLVLILLVFTTLRGLATCAWLPWITAIVPRALRGLYLSRDRTYVSLASVVALAIAGLLLFEHDNLASYSLVFGVSFLGGAISLYFLNRIPEPKMAPATGVTTKVPWLSLLHDNAFLRLLLFSAAVQVFVLSTGTFVIVFVREEIQLQDGTILWITAGAALIGTVALRMLRHRVDRLGSRPFLGLVFLWWVVYYVLWFLLAAHVVDAALVVAPALLLMAGFFGAIYDLALTRLLMNSFGDRPAMTQYFALQSVIVSLLAGISPILWGWLLDSLRGLDVTVAGTELNAFALFFGLQWLLLGVVFLMLTQVHEASAASTGALLHQIFVEAPNRRIAALRSGVHHR
jgi:MFS family permease